MQRGNKSHVRRNNWLIATGAISILIIVLSSFSIYQSLKVVDRKSVDVFFIVGPHGGFDLNTSLIHLGQITAGGSSTRDVFFNNTYNYPVEVYITSEGEIEPYVSFNPTFSLQPGEARKESFSAYAPLDMPFGNYSGKITIITKRK